MSRIYAYKTDRTTSTGQAVYGVVFAHESNCPQNYDVASLGDLCAGDDTWHNVLDENAGFIVLNAAGQIDIDREALAAHFAALAAQPADDADTYDYD